ncbi:MAG: hypothetical protein CM15mL4_0890 [uncultured marine virus]|nr:MAG: hypothetical protein CM15mL4_0890 [uncultured marine virus]
MDWFKEMEYSAFDVKGSGNIFDLAQGIFATFASGTLEWFKIIAPGFYKDSDWGKMHNNITIARAVVSGKVVNHVPLQHEIADFRNRIDLSVFKDSSRMYIPISSSRHEYADKNIYVLDGKVYNNRKEGNTDLTVNKYGQGMNFGPVNASGDPTGGLGGHGTGYAQLIIPEDGGKPYVHYYDYNYHNLKNPDDLPIGGAGRAVTGFASDMAHLFGLLNKIPGMHDPAYLSELQKAFEEKFNNLGNEESFIGEGWPTRNTWCCTNRFQDICG